MEGVWITSFRGLFGYEGVQKSQPPRAFGRGPFVEGYDLVEC